jgi:ABC-2 type transport system ATP-binding protein
MRYPKDSVSRRLLRALGEDEPARTIRTLDLAFRTDLQIHEGVAEGAAAPVATDNATFHLNDFIRLHDALNPSDLATIVDPIDGRMIAIAVRQSISPCRVVPPLTTSIPAFANETAIETLDLAKTYPGRRGQPPVRALRGVTLSVPAGSFFGLLGPNGAGKSTLINILAGLVIRTSGEARIWGYDIDRDMRAARRAIGVVPQELNIDPFFTPRELLDVQAGLYGVPKDERRTDEILEAVGLTRQAGAYARSLSGGMRRRLLVGKAMVHSPPVLVLDEPTAGVDVELRRQLWSYVRRLKDDGVTILLTTHYLEEAQALCDRIAIINHGRLIADDTTEALLRRLDAKEMTVTVAETLDSVPEPLSRFNVELARPGRLVFHYPPSRINSGEILNALRDAGLTITDLNTREAELEDIFLQLTRQPDGEDAAGVEG